MQHKLSKLKVSGFYSATIGEASNKVEKDVVLKFPLLKLRSKISIILIVISTLFSIALPETAIAAQKKPNPPTNVIAVAGNAQATVSFTPPTFVGASPITSYKVTSSPDGITKTGVSSPLVVTGLTNGTAYTFTVVATNSYGNSIPSLPSAPVTPATVPGAPINIVAVAGNAQSTVSFTPPVNNGGSVITSYTITSNPGGITKTGVSSPLVVTGLTNGTSYTFTVVATNAIGNSLPSAISNSVTPTTVPDVPTNIVAEAGDAQAIVSFTPPANDGGSAITSYTVTSTPGNISQTSTASPITVTGLTNGTSYTFTVVATNAIGNSLPSAISNSVTPATIPDVPTNIVAEAGDAQAIVSFTPPANDGGSAITSYTVTSTPGNISQTSTASPITVTGLTNGTAYTFTVVATNAIGNSLPSAASASVIPSAQLLAIYEKTETVYHMITSVDSLVFASVDKVVVYKQDKYFEYDRTLIDSIGVVYGSSWTDSQNACLDVIRYGVTGDGTTDNKISLDNAILAARSEDANLYFPNGNYLYNGGMNAQNVRFIGQSKDSTIIKESLLAREHNIDGAENLTFQNFTISDYNTSLSRVFKNCLVTTTLPVEDSFIQLYTGVYTYNADVQFLDCDFFFPKIYISLFIRKYNSVLISNCTFNGDAWHNIRLDEPYNVDAKVNVINNKIYGGTTGIFIAPSQGIPMKGGLIEGNELFNQHEESIAMDGYGNDAGMIPVIANGPIASVTNDINGRLVVSLNLMVNSYGVAAQVSLRSDWKNFYFSFGEGSGIGGTYVKIYDFNALDNTLTLDTMLVAGSVTVGGDAGVQSGFFDWIIRGNSVTGTLGANNTYGTAISVYLNAFGTLVENNIVTNCAHGINVAGGTMVNNCRTLAYNNLIRNNIFTDCDQYAVGDPSEEIGVVRFISYWGGTGPLQYNNRFENNTVNGGRIFIESQRNFVEIGNTYNNVTRLAVDVQ